MNFDVSLDQSGFPLSTLNEIHSMGKNSFLVSLLTPELALTDYKFKGLNGVLFERKCIRIKNTVSKVLNPITKIDVHTVFL